MVETAVETNRIPTPTPSQPAGRDLSATFASPTPPSAPTASITPAQAEDYLHELRVRIPVDLHRQLLSLKVLRGKSLAETVSTALDIYFQEHARKVSDATGKNEA